jgi:putative sporulation protein YtxC
VLTLKLYKIAVPKEDHQHLSRFRNILHSESQKIEPLNIHFQLIEREEKDYYQFWCQFWPGCEYTIDMLDAIRNSISQSIGEYVVECKEKDYLKEIMMQDFSYCKEEEWEEIYPFILSVFDEDHYDEYGRYRRKGDLRGKIAKRIFDFLDFENTFSIDGFIRFRLKDQWEEWRRTVEHCIEEYLVDKEYNEFIRLLRCLVSVQEYQNDLVHVVHIDDQNLLIYDEAWKQINGFANDSKSGLSTTDNYEQIFINRLISAAAKNIILHTDQETHQIIYTIKKAFEQRVKICSVCPMCQKIIKDVELL